MGMEITITTSTDKFGIVVVTTWGTSGNASHVMGRVVRSAEDK
jgi:hypothetical protein